MRLIHNIIGRSAGGGRREGGREMNWSRQACGIVLTALLFSIIPCANAQNVIAYNEGTPSERILAFFTPPSAAPNQWAYAYKTGFAGTWHSWKLIGWPPRPSLTRPLSAITYRDNNGLRWIYVFGGGSDGRLYLTYCYGPACDTPESWPWIDLGAPDLPSGIITHSAPWTITYRDTNGAQRIYVFFAGTDQKLWMCVCVGPECGTINSAPGCTWSSPASLANMPPLGPHDSAGAMQPRAITYRDGDVATSNQQIYVFARSEDNRLLLARCTGPACEWSWQALGSPNAVTPIALKKSPYPITYRDIAGRRINVFTLAEDGKLHMASCTGGQCDDAQASWPWENRGTWDNRNLDKPPQAITFHQEGNQRIYVFAHHTFDHLVVNYFDGSRWSWRPISGMSEPSRYGFPGVLTYRVHFPHRLHRIFVVARKLPNVPGVLQPGDQEFYSARCTGKYCYPVGSAPFSWTIQPYGAPQ